MAKEQKVQRTAKFATRCFIFQTQELKPSVWIDTKKPTKKRTLIPYLVGYPGYIVFLNYLHNETNSI